jgi:predicted ester cyclase
MDERPQAPFDIAHGARADAGSFRELLLRHAGRQAQALQGGAEGLVDVAQIGDSNGDLVSWRPRPVRNMINSAPRATFGAAFSTERKTAMRDRETTNTQTIRTLYEEVLNEGRLELLDEIAWPDHLEHNPFPQQGQGAEGLKQRASMVRAAFNPRFTLKHVIAEGDKVAIMWSNEGTHVGDWFGFAPTGKNVTAHGVDVFLLRDGRLAEHWDVVDITDFLAKVGVLPDSTAPTESRR